MNAIDHPPAALHRPTERSRVHRNHGAPALLLGATRSSTCGDADAKKAAPAEDPKKALVSAARAGSCEVHTAWRRAPLRHGPAKYMSLVNAAKHSPEPLRGKLLDGLADHFDGVQYHHMTRVPSSG